MNKTIAPTIHTDIFDCPHCKCRSIHEWRTVYKLEEEIEVAYAHSYSEFAKSSPIIPVLETVGEPYIFESQADWEFNISVCNACGEYMIWKDEQSIYPIFYNIEEPNVDMPEDVASLYNEARGIVQLSPRSACALLRLALEKLLVQHLNCPKDKKLFDNIKKLRSEGKIHDSVYDAMESVRLVGNNSVHPGMINVDDDNKYAHTLFGLLNYIVDEMISREIRIKSFRELLIKNR